MGNWKLGESWPLGRQMEAEGLLDKEETFGVHHGTGEGAEVSGIVGQCLIALLFCIRRARSVNAEEQRFESLGIG